MATYTISKIQLPNGDVCNISTVDEKVKQTAISTTNWHRALLTNANSFSAESTQLDNDATAQEANYSTKIAIQPSSGTLRANKIRIDEDSSSSSPSNVVLSYNATDNSLDFIFTYVVPTET